MHLINIKNWPRKSHFEFFNGFVNPIFGLTAKANITKLAILAEEKKLNFTYTVIYALSLISNLIPEFRHRIVNGKPVEFDRVDPSITIFKEDKTFGFSRITFERDLFRFVEICRKQIENDKEIKGLNPIDEQDLVYMTCIPWISFTHFTHPITTQPPDCIPRMAWGKYVKSGGEIFLPLNVQVHHALADGYHVGQYFIELERFLEDPRGSLKL